MISKRSQAPPPYGKRIVTLQIELEGTDKASLVFSGRLYEYRDRFIAKEIGGGFPGEGDDKGKYCRVMKSVDVSDETSVELVFNVSVGFLVSRVVAWLVFRASYSCMILHTLGPHGDRRRRPQACRHPRHHRWNRARRLAR